MKDALGVSAHSSFKIQGKTFAAWAPFPNLGDGFHRLCPLCTKLSCFDLQVLLTA